MELLQKISILWRGKYNRFDVGLTCVVYFFSFYFPDVLPFRAKAKRMNKEIRIMAVYLFDFYVCNTLTLQWVKNYVVRDIGKYIQQAC